MSMGINDGGHANPAADGENAMATQRDLILVAGGAGFIEIGRAHV